MKIDFHAHILPAMDHGCKNMEMCNRQLNMAAEQKIDVVIATSHFYPHEETDKCFLDRRREAWGKLNYVRQGRAPKVLLGAEVLICSGMDKMEHLEELCIEGTDVLLLEMPFADQWEQELIDTVEKIVTVRKLRVVLAHAERYRLAEVEKLLEFGVMVQINADSLDSCFQKWKRYHRARKLLKKKCVVALGSDIHGVENMYYIFSKVCRKYKKEATQIQERTQELLRDVLAQTVEKT